MERAHDILDRLMAEPARTRERGRTRHIALAPGALAAVPAWLAAEHPVGVAVLVADEPTFEAAGRAVQTGLEAVGYPVRTLLLEPRPGDDHVVCEAGVIEALQTFLRTSDRLVPLAVGAGTVNDIVKMASFRLGLPYVCVPTAASMNGYTSSIAAVLADGVKRTWGCHQPDAIFADVDVLRAAPPVMNRAGFGDLLSKPYSHADWLLSHLVRGVDYSREAATVLDEPWRRMVEGAAGIGRGDADAVHVLTETLLVSGFSMALAGTSSPASGGEHLISHYWDMEQHCRGEELRGLHGTQVGVGTLLSARLFERLVALDAAAIDPDAAAARRPDPSWIDRLDAEHPHLTPPVLAEVKEQLRAKQRHGDALRAELADVRDRWDALRATLREALLPADVVARALREAGCADRASQLGVSRDDLVRTLRVCRHIRSRYVALDLLDDLGVLDRWAAEVADATEAA